MRIGIVNAVIAVMIINYVESMETILYQGYVVLRG